MLLNYGFFARLIFMPGNKYTPGMYFPCEASLNPIRTLLVTHTTNVIITHICMFSVSVIIENHRFLSSGDC